MKFLRVELSKDGLLSLPEKERVFFLALGNLANEINALSKASVWSATGTHGEGSPENHGQITNIVFFIRLLAGKLNEAWEMFQANFFGAAISKIYEPLLDGNGAKALDTLKKYFGKTNSAHQLRNHVAFHYSPKELDEALHEINEPLIAYLDNSSAPNNLFYYSEMLVTQSIVTLLKLDKTKSPLDPLIGELFGISACFVTAADGLMEAIIQKHGKELRSKEPELITIKDLPDFNSLAIPWFSDTSSLTEPK